MCDQQPLLPLGQHDVAGLSAVKLYCARCEDIYNPKSSRHASIDGAYFGTSFHNVLFQVFPTITPLKTHKRFEPKLFGFRVHAAASLVRWQANEREQMKDRLDQLGLPNGFGHEDEPDDDGLDGERVEEIYRPHEGRTVVQ